MAGERMDIGSFQRTGYLQERICTSQQQHTEIKKHDCVPCLFVETSKIDKLKTVSLVAVLPLQDEDKPLFDPGGVFDVRTVYSTPLLWSYQTG